MKKVLFRALLIGLALSAGASSTVWGQTNAWGQKSNTYHFGDAGKAKPTKLPKMLPGRIHFLDGSTRNGPVGFVDYNQIVVVDNNVTKKYTPLEVSSFVMKQDSFVVLRDFKIALGADEQEFRIAFVQLNVAGPGFALYHFRGTMRHDDVEHYRNVPAYNGSNSSGAVVQYSIGTEYSLSKVWFIKRADDPRWLSLSSRGLRDIVEPIIADDKKLVRSIEWNFLSADGVQDVLLKYVANKRSLPN
ncbi:MAG: hypothetical protein JWR44_2913 [Hymenobacter sp.]|jgi:hypothetical protein|nr:hypothetical protein [Hymenobacter sp.]